MDDNNEPLTGQKESATQIVNFTNVAEALLTNPLGVPEISGTCSEEELPSSPLDIQDVVSADLQAQDIERLPNHTPEAVESSGRTEEEGGLSPMPFHTFGVIPIGLQDLGAQPRPTEPQEAPQILKSKAETLNSNNDVPLDEVLASREKHAPEVSSPVGPENRQEKEKSPASQIEPPLPAPNSILKEGTSSETPAPLAAPAPLKKFIENLPAGMLQWATGDASGQSARRKTIDAKRDALKMSQKKDGLPETAQKAPDRKDTGKAPASNPLNSCKLDIIMPMTRLEGLTVDIITIHDFDETSETAWTFIPRAPTQRLRRNFKESDNESRRSSTERYRQQLQENVTVSDAFKKRRASTQDETTPGFKAGRITPEGRNQKVAEWEVPNVFQETDAATPGILLSQAGPSNEPARQAEPRNEDTSVVGPPTNEVETVAIPSGAYKNENVELEAKASKSVKKRRRKGVPSNAIPTGDPLPQAISENPSKMVSLTAQIDAVVDSRRDSKDTGEGRASEKDQRSGRPSTEVDGSERRRPVHLFRDAHMIPAAFPGVRILSFTYPELTAEIAEEYLDKVTQTLLDSLVKARAKIPSNTTPIVFIGYGFGGLVLQKLLVMSIAAHENREASQVLNMTAGLVFLDTPFPAAKQDDKPETYPFPAQNARQKHIMGRLKEFGNKLDIDALWKTFDVKRQIQDQKLPIVWLYTIIAKDPFSASKIQPKRPLSALAPQGIFCMAMASDSSKRALSRFSNPKDPIYLRLVGQVRRCLLFKASERKELESLLKGLINSIDPKLDPDAVDVEDEQGRSALHCAASSPNDVAVTVLIHRGQANVLHQDTLGQTPLHLAIKKAVELNPTKKESQKPFEEVIIRLMENSEDISQADYARKTAWTQANDLAWIQNLKDSRDMFSGPSISDGPQLLEPLARPGSPQIKACEDFRGDLVEFYLVTKELKTEEKRNHEKSYVVDMIYNLGPQTILERSRPKIVDQALQCRWLHVPANVEQWIHDLFITLKIRDSSMTGQQEGSSRHTLHMIAQATKYKQICEPHYWEARLDDRNDSAATKPTTIPRNVTDPEPATENSMGNSHDETFPTNAEGIRDKLQIPALTRTMSGETLVAKTVTVDRDAIVLFMPILAYETSVLRKKMSKTVRRILRRKEIEENNNDTYLLRAYLDDAGTKPLHCRRTLDQFSYYMLDTTESRDRDQVLWRWGRKKLEKAAKAVRRDDAPVLMVDQLWLWVLHDGTVITSFPNSWDQKQTYGLKKKLDEEIKTNKKRDPITSVDHLVHLIIKLSVDFLRQDGPGTIKFQEAFLSSINNVAEREAEQFKRFKDLTRKLNIKTLTEAQRTKHIEKLFQLNIETHLLVEIKDIQDELNIVASIFGEQRDVLNRLHKLCSSEKSTTVDSSSEIMSKQKQVKGVDLVADKIEEQSVSPEKPKQKGILHHNNEKEEAPVQDRKKEKKVHFGVLDEDLKNTDKETPVLTNRSLVDDNLGIVLGNIRIVEDMQHYAAQVHTSINHLLDLKQRQANAWEARFSREGSQQSQRQGNIMLVFTLVTIVFLPLSFMSSFFALSINSFPKDAQSGNTSWPLHTVALLLFGISTLVFVPLVLIALYVNQITTFTKETFKSFVLRKTESIDKIEDNEEDDIDEESVKDEDDTDDDYETIQINDGDDITVDASSDKSTYAPIFGRWNFHTHIPILRKLWERQVYLHTLDDDEDYLFDEAVETDYPLHHFLSKIPLWNLLPSSLTLWWFEHELRKQQTDSDGSSIVPGWLREPKLKRNVVEERYPRREWIRRGSGGSDDIFEITEEESDPPLSRARRIFGAVESLFRKKGRHRNSSSSYDYYTETGSSARNSDEVVVVIEENRDYGARRRASENSSNSDDVVEVIEGESNGPPSRSRAIRMLGPVERLFRRRDRDRDERETASYEGSSAGEAGSASGSERQEVTARGLGLGVALPEPLRRLFIRRRRIRDIESLEDD